MLTHAMQYTITLPADYDMAVIRRRVRDRGPLTDDFPGLVLKAYLVRERGVDGSPVNAYAPFYLWGDSAGLGSFLWGGRGFGGIVTDFGRPTVRHWIGAGLAAGPSARLTPRAATLHRTVLPDGADPAGAMAEAAADLAARAGTAGVHTTAVALDPDRWELVHATLWEREIPEGVLGDRFQLLHLSAPGLGEERPSELELS
ncbi:DUF4865 family protein [Streptacidiphilus sp. N1-12]|uniref:DUF4865 family protein n=2 Tax=Streptacidiphilus alkalitolerans TaxID=3342712 RepID=A0ABV6WDB9_9ACTN